MDIIEIDNVYQRKPSASIMKNKDNGFKQVLTTS